MSDYYDKGWDQFPFDINLYNWAIKGGQIATEKIHLLKEYKKELPTPMLLYSLYFLLAFGISLRGF